MIDPVESLGPLEEELLNLVWNNGNVTAREVFERQAPAGVRAYTTFMTTLDRLFHKGLLRRDKEGLAWRYAAAVTREAFQQARVDALAARIVARHGDAGLAAFVDAAAAADGPLLDRLEELIRARRVR
jgi:predicted transcriptional regulator